MNDIFDKKDYTYWIIILMIFLTGLSTSEFAHDTTIVNYISFAGTITSILLALIAIVYSYIQNFTNTTLSKQLKESADRIENVSSKLDGTLSIIENVSGSVTDATDNIKSSSKNIENLTCKIDTSLEGFISSSKELSNQFALYTSTMQDNMNRNFDVTITKITGMSQTLNELKNPGQASTGTTTSIIEPDKNSISNFLIRTSKAGIISIYLLSKLYLNKISNFSLEPTLKAIFGEYYLYYHGFIICTLGTSLILFKYQDDSRIVITEISHFDQLLIDLVNEKIKEFKDEDIIKSYIEKIDGYVNSNK